MRGFLGCEASVGTGQPSEHIARHRLRRTHLLDEEGPVLLLAKVNGILLGAELEVDVLHVVGAALRRNIESADALWSDRQACGARWVAVSLLHLSPLQGFETVLHIRYLSA